MMLALLVVASSVAAQKELTADDVAISHLNLLLPCSSAGAGALTLDGDGLAVPQGAASHVINIESAAVGPAATAAVADACFKWDVSGSMASITRLGAAGEPAPDGADACALSARIEAGDDANRGSCPPPQRMGASMSVSATLQRRGDAVQSDARDVVLRCEVQLAPVARLSFSTSWRVLHMNQTERIKIRAFDGANNTFNSLHGLRFEWTVDPPGLLQFEPVSSSATRTSRAIKELEERGQRGSEVVLRGLKRGVATLTARIIDRGYGTVESTVIEIDVIEKLEIVPLARQWVLPLTRVQYTLKVNDAILPPPFDAERFRFESSEPAVARAESSSATALAMRRGTAHIIVSTVPLPKNEKAVELHVVHPTAVRVCWALRLLARESTRDATRARECAVAEPPEAFCATLDVADADASATPPAELFLVHGRTYDVRVTILSGTQRVRTEGVEMNLVLRVASAVDPDVLELMPAGASGGSGISARGSARRAESGAACAGARAEDACFEQTPAELGPRSLVVELPLPDASEREREREREHRRPDAAAEAETDFKREWIFPVRVVRALHLTARPTTGGLRFARKLPLRLLHGYPFALRASGGTGQVEWFVDARAAARGVVLSGAAWISADGLRANGSDITITTDVQLSIGAQIEARDRRSGQSVTAVVVSGQVRGVRAGQCAALCGDEPRPPRVAAARRQHAPPPPPHHPPHSPPASAPSLLPSIDVFTRRGQWSSASFRSRCVRISTSISAARSSTRSRT